MASRDERDDKVDALHALLVSARVDINKAIALNSSQPVLAGAHDLFRALAEARRVLTNATANLPWRRSTASQQERPEP